MGVGMAEIIPLAHYREQSALRAGLKIWRQQFQNEFNAYTRLADLSSVNLCRLAETGQGSAAILFRLVIGLLGHKATTTFEGLNSQTKSQVLDIHLFLSDQIHFEVMHRLGWLDGFVGNQFPIYKMVRQFEHIKTVCQCKSPSLAADHPRYNEYQHLMERDQQVFIRRLLATALEVFKRTFNR